MTVTVKSFSRARCGVSRQRSERADGSSASSSIVMLEVLAGEVESPGQAQADRQPFRGPIAMSPAPLSR